MKFLLVLLLVGLPVALSAQTLPPTPTPAQIVAAPVIGTTPLTLKDMFATAHPLVQGVMALLAGAALLTWTVALVKSVELALARARVRRAARAIRAADSLEAAALALAHRLDPASFLANAAQAEVLRSEPALALAGTAGLKERVASIALRTEAQAAARLRRGIGLLATIGATAPFVGLFGTVWGIMNAFVGIADARSTNLAIVAPGIAEALLATAAGLGAAIPAVVLYNLFVRALAGWRLALADAGAGVERLLSRDLDFRVGGGPR
ncbi:outer membrane transport energization protein ExbB [Rhodobacter viridis]|uniref:Biopolymer transport protein ExbB n=1 Tax=Rhodobacter viridis TaxID=1054202 RepID=A0A318TUX6_9RHOB|nr:tonB-system energizer ExbB [Rhodobacter viridis]PYF08681.1 outer membrane transport energization protein ExbB [Rhodobacter viridis]